MPFREEKQPPLSRGEGLLVACFVTFIMVGLPVIMVGFSDNPAALKNIFNVVSLICFGVIFCANFFVKPSSPEPRMIRKANRIKLAVEMICYFIVGFVSLFFLLLYPSAIGAGSGIGLLGAVYFFIILFSIIMNSILGLLTLGGSSSFLENLKKFPVITTIKTVLDAVVLTLYVYIFFLLGF